MAMIKNKFLKKYLILFAASTVIFAGCERDITDDESVSRNNESIIEETSENNELITEETSENSETTTEIKVIENYDFFGTWKFEKIALVSAINSLSTRETYRNLRNGHDEEDYIGEEFEFSDKFLRVGNDVHYNPKYNFYSESVSDFDDNLAVHMGLNGGRYSVTSLYMLIRDKEVEVDFVDGDDGYILRKLQVQFDVNDDYKEKYHILYDFDDVTILNKDTILVNDFGKVLMAKRVKNAGEKG